MQGTYFRAHRSASRPKERGFSMLETVAALTILAIGAVVVFSWLGQTTLQLDRYAKAEQRNLARIEALTFLRTLNPSAQPQGKLSFVSFTLTWNAQLEGQLRSSLSANGTQDNYDVGLYTVTATLTDSKEAELTSMALTLEGYTKPRMVSSDALFK